MFAYRPVVNLTSGNVHGFSTRIKNLQKLGFKSHAQMMDKAHDESVLSYVELQLRKKAVMDIIGQGFYEDLKVFYKFDRRVLSMVDFHSDEISILADSVNILGDMVCLQISEKRSNYTASEINSLFSIYKNKGYKIVIEDFGANSFNFKMLYYITPDYVKIDSFFIKNVKNDIKKRIFLSKLLDTARMIGSITIVKGVDTKEDLYVCKELGVDLVEGDLIAEPESDVSKLKMRYDHIKELVEQDRRGNKNRKKIEKNLTMLEGVYVDEDMFTVLEKFKRNKNYAFLPVLDRNNTPVGVIQDKDLKEYVYSSFGTSLLVNKSTSINVKRFLTKCAIADINTKLEDLLKSFSVVEESIGIIITKDTKYYGFLTSKALLNALNEQNISVARDQNPLTKLPGNIPIVNFIQEAIFELSKPLYLAYFDFDNFKPFNDKYGFRVGDRAILLFAEILQSRMHMQDFFVGHIGGDDFFAGYRKGDDFARFYETIVVIMDEFKEEAKKLYGLEDREKCCVVMKDRDGVEKKFGFLSVSTAILEISSGERRKIDRMFDEVLSKAKKSAKSAKNNICALSLITD